MRTSAITLACLRRAPVLFLAIGAAVACGGRVQERTATLAGSWRAALDSPGGQIPFDLKLETAPDGRLRATVLNGAEEAPFTTAVLYGRRLTLSFDHYDSEIVATIAPGGGEMEGRWGRQALRRRDEMPFHAWRRSREGDSARFGPPAVPAGSSAVADVTGNWDVLFTDEEGTSAARAEFRQEGERARGTFLTPTGDYRYLDGEYREGILRLSCFDGAHAFLFSARALDDGSLTGDFWSRGAYHATWTARRAGGGPGDLASNLPDPFVMTTLKNPTGRLQFTFPDLDGRPVSLGDARFTGKVVLVDIFGSWCPNCNDQAPLLADLHRRYRDRGLEIVGLAYEMRGDPARDVPFVRKYAERHRIEFPLLLAGTGDKAEASATLPDLSGVLAFPTLIFVGRDGAVRAIHTGFEGPGTGRHHEALKERYETLIETML